MKKLSALILVGWFFIVEIPGCNSRPTQFGPFKYKADCEQAQKEIIANQHPSQPSRRRVVAPCFEGA